MTCLSREAARQEACTALRTVLHSSKTPLTVVTGNTLSSLSWLYQQLDEVCAAIPDCHTVRLVSHHAGMRGYRYCESHLAFIDFPPSPRSAARATAPPWSPQLFTQAFLETAVTHSDNPSRATAAPHARGWPHSEPQHIVWVVPHILSTNLSSVEALLRRWPAHVPRGLSRCRLRVQFVWFINTDLLTTTEQALWDTQVGPAASTVRWLPLEDTPLRSTLPALRAHYPPVVSAAADEQATAISISAPSVAVLSLKAPTLLEDVHQVAALTDTTDLVPRVGNALSAVSADGYAQPDMSWLLSMVAARTSASASPPCPVLLPCASAVARQEGSLHAHNLAGARVHAARHRSARARSYYPQVVHVGSLLATEVCLSPLFVFEYGRCEARGTPHSVGGSPSVARTSKDASWSALQAQCAAQLRTLLSGGIPVSVRGDLVADVMEASLRQLIPDRQVFGWSVTDPLEPDVLRCTLCVSYEVFSPHSLLYPGCHPDARIDPMLFKPHTGSQDQTMENSLRRVLEFVRALDWRLVHQTYHESWCDERSPTMQSASTHSDVAEFRSSSAPSVHSTVSLAARVRLRVAQERNVTLEDATDLSPTWPIDDTRRTTRAGETQSVTTKSSGRTSRTRHPPRHLQTHPCIWQAALVGQSEGLHLWLGAVVSLPTGERGTVVGFAPASRIRHQSGTSSPARSDNMDAVCSVWQPALPLYISEMETQVYPLVSLHASSPDGLRRRVLADACDTVEVVVPYPTTCRAARREHRYLEDEVGDPLCGPDATFDRHWDLPRSPRDDVVTIARLALRLAYFFDASSLFMALVLRHGLFRDAKRQLGEAPSQVSRLARWSRSRRAWSSRDRSTHALSSAASTSLPPTHAFQRDGWIRMHRQRFPMTSLAHRGIPEVSLLSQRWCVSAHTFARHPSRLRCALACLCASRGLNQR